VTTGGLPRLVCAAAEAFAESDFSRNAAPDAEAAEFFKNIRLVVRLFCAAIFPPISLNFGSFPVIDLHQDIFFRQINT
jgi:hypothetical protein